MTELHARILSNPDFHAWAPEILKAVRRDRFIDAAASLYTEIGMSSDEFEAIATAAAAAMRMKDGPGKAKRLRELAVLTLKRIGPDNRGGADSRRFAEDMFEWAHRHDGSRSWEATPYEVLIGYVVGGAEHAMAAGVPFDPDGLAETVHAAVVWNNESFSITDVADTIRAMTIHRPLADWVLPEELERLRPIMHERLLKSLRSPDCLEWLRDAVMAPDGGDWLLEQLQAPAERALLRKRLRELRNKTDSQASN